MPDPKNPLDEHGYTICAVCNQKKFIKEIDTCGECGNWVCTSGCASYRRQFPFGHICKKCQDK